MTSNFSKPNILQKLEENALNKPNETAYFFLKDKSVPCCTLTYQQLEQQTKAIASHLSSQVNPGSRVLLIYPPGLDFIAAFLGCFYARVIAVPAPSLDIFGASRAISRLKGIVENAQPSLILTTEETQQQIEILSETIGQIDGCQTITTDSLTIDSLTTDSLATDDLKRRIETELQGEDVAYLQYTSGSTSMPKGVMVTYDNLTSNLNSNAKALDIQSDSILANWMPHYHDAGLVAGLMQSLYTGISCYVISPLALMIRPVLLLEAASVYRITHTIGTNFIYDYCVTHTSEKQRQKLDLSSLEFVGVGAEPVRKETLERFNEAFRPHGFNAEAFSPGYGLAESTLTVSATPRSEVPKIYTLEKEALSNNQIVEISDESKQAHEKVTVVGCGYPVGDTQVFIINPDTLAQCDTDQVGEIWVSSESVAKGYWNHSAATKETFQAKIENSSEVSDDSFLRTGDLGFIKEGQLFVTGRFKDLIILRGKNYYPQDIELAIENSHSKVRSNCSVVFSVEIEGNEKLVAVSEIDPPYTEESFREEIIAAIRNAVAQNCELSLYGIALLKRGAIPRTSSGKVQRHICRHKFLNQSLDSIEDWNLNSASTTEIVVPRNEYELRLQQIWEEVLERKPISIHDNFFELGGNSLLAANITDMIEFRLGYKLPLSILSEQPTIAKLSSCLDKPAWYSEQRSLVAIKPEGHKRPFFYVHPASGTVLLTSKLSRYIEAERPMYGLQSVGISGEKEPLTSIEEMAAYYIEEIKTVQPEGPYLLGGRCVGGRIAFDMAQQLMREGQKVLSLVLVESPLSRRMIDPLVAEETKQNILKIRALGLEQASTLQKVVAANNAAARKYKPRIYVGQIAYFNAEDHERDALFDFGWARWTTNKVDIYEIPGNHKTISEEPNIQVFANALSNCLNKSELNNTEINPDLLQGYIYHQQVNLELAVDSYLKAIELEPDNAQIYFLLGSVQRKKGDLEKAIDSYKQAVKLQHSYYWIHEAMADVLYETGQVEEALRVYSIVVNLGHARSRVYYRIAKAHLKRGDIDNAISSLLEAISLNPKHVRASLELGNIYYDKEMFEEAISSYDRAIQTDPQQPFRVYKKLGDCLRKNNKNDKAIHAYSEALKIRPNSRNLRNVLRKLKAERVC